MRRIRQVELQVPLTVLDVGPICWVQFGVTEPGYYIGMVTPIFERPCPSKRPRPRRHHAGARVDQR